MSARIRSIHAAARGTYGAPRVHADLAAGGDLALGLGLRRRLAVDRHCAAAALAFGFRAARASAGLRVRLSGRSDAVSCDRRDGRIDRFDCLGLPLRLLVVEPVDAEPSVGRSPEHRFQGPGDQVLAPGGADCLQRLPGGGLPL
ncbi:hypothetical protein [Pseudoxanthobacter sp. M-2]|uniref:hypothetical protein n=1 Tax=Pseudoxanthobacter sp. M-2 TaxID=3078754 RepID=UPI0038FCDD50